jgi:lipoate-protein ligase A
VIEISAGMFSLIQESHDPFFNLAAEEYLLHDRKEDFFILSVNDPSVIIGKHQVTHREVNTRFTTSRKIPVIRRISGGGAVYHDRGNLNFAFIRQSEHGKQVDFRYYTQPVIDFLGSLGVAAVFGGKNDLTVDGLKISGNAEHVFRERVLHHGTLLFSASVDNMKQALRPVTDNYSSRGVESNRTPVVNLSDRLKDIRTMDMLMTSMSGFFSTRTPGISAFSFSPEEIVKVKNLAAGKYNSWEWNYAYGPPYTFTRVATFSGIEHNIRFIVKDGIIWESDISGSRAFTTVAKKLIGCRHIPDDIDKILKSEDIIVGDDELYAFF